VIFSYAQRRKQTVYYLSVNTWVSAAQYRGTIGLAV